MAHYLAVDIGAESGRVILGTVTGGRLELEELHRFPNTPVRIPQGLYWDTFRLWHEVQQGLAVAGRQRKLKVDGIGVDTWGCDFGLFGPDGALIDNPRHYRDARNHGMTDAMCQVVPRERIFEHTGIQFMDLNSLCQLFAIKRSGSPALPAAKTLLFMPDILNYWLTGVRKAELTIASTSQFCDPRTKDWSVDLLAKLGLPTEILPEIVPPGARLGTIRPEVADVTALDPGTTVFASASHDTAAAVAAVPAEAGGWCYISSGTWSLMGAELDDPIMNEKALAENLTNEIGVDGKIRLLKNIAGMWPVQECRRAWAREGKDYSYAHLAGAAGAAEPFAAVIKPDDFLEPGHMPERIAEYCRSSGQKIPEQPGGMVRSILESLALRYRQVLQGLEPLLGRRIEVIHIVGGGSQNKVLNQFVANATKRRVVAGPTEATAAGNVLVQAIGAGQLRGLAEARQVIQSSFPVETVEPSADAGWDEAYERFLQL